MNTGSGILPGERCVATPNCPEGGIKVNDPLNGPQIHHAIKEVFLQDSPHF